MFLRPTSQEREVRNPDSVVSHPSLWDCEGLGTRRLWNSTSQAREVGLPEVI
jgi:hypothetical protein